MKNGSRLLASTAIAALSIPLAIGISGCGEDNPAQQAIDSQIQNLQDQANQQLNEQTEEARKRAQEALDQATDKANDAIDQAQSQVDDAVPTPPQRP